MLHFIPQHVKCYSSWQYNWTKTEQVWLFWRVARRKPVLSKNNMAAWLRFENLHLNKSQGLWNKGSHLVRMPAHKFIQTYHAKSVFYTKLVQNVWTQLEQSDEGLTLESFFNFSGFLFGCNCFHFQLALLSCHRCVDFCLTTSTTFLMFDKFHINFVYTHNFCTKEMYTWTFPCTY